MSAVVLTEIERRLDELSFDEQLRLLERLAVRVRRQFVANTSDESGDLAAMAADPDIQRELRLLEGA